MARYDVDGNRRITYDELEALCRDKFADVPPDLAAVFDAVKYTSSATDGRPALDMVMRPLPQMSTGCCDDDGNDLVWN